MRPGYPKLISDVWGIEGPIDAAFTRINCQGKTYLFKVGCRAGGTPRVVSTAPQPTLYPLLAPPIHPYTPWLPETPNPCGCSGTPSNHSPVMGFPGIHSLLLADLWLGDVAPVTPLCPPPLRAPSTGALMTEPWTLGTHGTSPRALRAFPTTWTQPSPSLPTATTAMRESISSRVRGQPLLLAEPGTTGHRLGTPPVPVPH